MDSIHAHFKVKHHDFSLDIDLRLPGTGISALFGPSGSGKTTCLRAMAGLEKLNESYFSIGHSIWQDSSNNLFVPPHQREIGYVFQEASLFPHMSVRDNLNFGFNRTTEAKRKIKFEDICQILALTLLLDRKPSSLSGGERQRVAIGRALLTSPKLLLMDEPLSALDHGLKSEVLPYLERLSHTFAIPIIYVSHSPDEVARLADYIAIIKQGELVKSGALQQVMLNADAGILFNGERSCLFYTVVTAYQNPILTALASGSLTLLVPKIDAEVNQAVRCQINATDVSICLSKPLDSSITNIIAGRIIEMNSMHLVGEQLITIEVADNQRLLATITNASTQRLQLHTGCQVWAQIKSVAIL